MVKIIQRSPSEPEKAVMSVQACISGAIPHRRYSCPKGYTSIYSLGQAQDKLKESTRN